MPCCGRRPGWPRSVSRSGWNPVPEVLLHPSVIERFAASAPGLSGSARRTLRTNLRFLARRVVPALAPVDAPLPRERAKAPYSAAEIAGYLALADAQPTVPRRMRAAGLVCLGAGAGLAGADLRVVRGTDVICRSGGVIVQVRGRRPRAVPVLARYHEPLLAAAAFAGTALVTGGTDPGRKNITTPLTRSLCGGTGLPRLEASRLRSTWLAGCARLRPLTSQLIVMARCLGDTRWARRPRTPGHVGYRAACFFRRVRGRPVGCCTTGIRGEGNDGTSKGTFGTFACGPSAIESVAGKPCDQVGRRLRLVACAWAKGAFAMGLPQGTVTFLLTDLEGSTRRWEAHPGEMRDALARHDTIVRGAVEAHGGVVFSTMGDGMAAVFASARDAVRAVLAAQAALTAEDWGEVTGLLAARMGLLTDEGVLGGENYLNQPLNRCARLMAAGHGGQALVSGATELLVRDDLPDGCGLVDLGEHWLRDLARPVRIFQLTGPGLRGEFPPLRTLGVQDRRVPLDVFVGREEELARVAEVVSRVEAGQPWLLAVEGEPGMGKTALARRCLAQAPGLKVLSARADQAETGLDFGIVDQLLRAAGDAVPTVPSTGGAGPAASSFAVGAHLLEVVGGQQATGAVALVVDDLQWADRRSVEALTFMLRRLSVDPVLAVVIYSGPSGRLDEAAQRLLLSVENRLHIPLGGLGLDEVAALAATLEVGSLDGEAVKRLYRGTGGHPLYLRTALSEGSGFDPREPGRLALPRSLAAAVGEHLRVLPPETRVILEMLSVLNLRLPLAQLGQAAEVDSPGELIERAVAAGLVDWWPDEPTCPVEIRHLLVRDAIYAGIIAAQRRLLHARAASFVSESASWEHRVAALNRPDEALAAELEHVAGEEAAGGRLTLAATHLQWASDISPARAGPGTAAADRGAVSGRRGPGRGPAPGGGGGGAVPVAQLRAGRDG